jgi:hypothetical protein
LVAIAVLWSGVASADKAEDLVDALKVQEQWSLGVVAPSIERYVQRSEPTLIRVYGAKQASAILAEQVAMIKEAATWDAVGKPIALLMYRQCDDAHLDTMLKLTLKRPIDPHSVNDDFEAKANACQSRIQPSLVEKFMETFQSTFAKMDGVLSKYKVLPADSTR